jgi:hypothetical protein
MPSTSRPERRGRYQKHGFYALRNAITKYNKRAMPLTLGRAMRERRQALIDACGGDDVVSPQRLVLIEKVVVQERYCQNVWIGVRLPRSAPRSPPDAPDPGRPDCDTLPGSADARRDDRCGNARRLVRPPWGVVGSACETRRDALLLLRP